MNSLKSAAATASLFAAMAAPALADPIVLDFEGVGNQASVNDFYNGGTDSAGHAGTDYGVHFNGNALGIIDSDAGGTGNIGNEPSPSTVLFFLTGSALLDYAPGFDTGFSFWYTTVDFGGTVKVYDGLGGTGNLLGSIAINALGTGPGDPNGAFSNWAIGSLGFAGIAKSIDFGGTVNQVAYDNITFGATTPIVTNVPEPSTYAMLALGLAGVGVVSRRRKTR